MKYYLNLFLVILFVSLYSCSLDGVGNDFDSDSNSDSTTLSGSYANILKVGNFLYAINHSELTTFLKTEAGIDKISTQNVGFMVENIFHADGVLFIGSQESMHIFTIDENGIPERKSETAYSDFAGQDVGPCDPVIARGDLAYVTLSTTISGPCSRLIQVNQLRIYDVTDLSHPSLISQTEMENPKGLGLKDNYLFVCESNNGFVVYDISDSENPIKVNHVEGFKSNDLIVNGNKLLVVGPSEIRQFDITDVNNIGQYGRIEI